MHEGYQNYQDPRLQPPSLPDEPGEWCVFRKDNVDELLCVYEVACAAGDPQLLARAEVDVIVPDQCVGCPHFEDERWSR